MTQCAAKKHAANRPASPAHFGLLRPISVSAYLTTCPFWSARSTSLRKRSLVDNVNLKRCCRSTGGSSVAMHTLAYAATTEKCFDGTGILETGTVYNLSNTRANALLQ